jgi:hypothetical protein
MGRFRTALPVAQERELTLSEVSSSTRDVYRPSVRQFTDWLAIAHPEIVAPPDITARLVRRPARIHRAWWGC